MAERFGCCPQGGGAIGPPTDDATIQASSPTTVNGTSGNLGVQGPNLQEAFMRFDLSVLPAGLQASYINKATLRLFVSNVSIGGSFDVRLVTGIWSEKTLTFNNAPPAGLLIALYAVPTLQSGICGQERPPERAGEQSRRRPLLQPNGFLWRGLIRTLPITAFGRSRPAADATHSSGAVIAQRF